MNRDLGNNMTFNGVRDIKCERCGRTKWNEYTYIWKTMISEIEVNVCQDCAIREEFGNKFSQNKRYKQWKERNKNG